MKSNTSIKVVSSFQLEIVSSNPKIVKFFRKIGYSVSYNRFVYLKKGQITADVIPFIKEKSVIVRKTYDSLDYDKYAGDSLINIPKWLIEKKRILSKKRSNYACQLGESYHRHVSNLYTSSRASVECLPDCFEKNKLRNVDNNAYSKSYGFPAVWQNAAAVLSNKKIELYTSRGTLKATFDMPHQHELDRFCFDDKVLLADDLYAIEVHSGVYRRFNWKNKFTGLAVKLQKPLSEEMYIEHGQSMSEIKAEFSHKLIIAERDAQTKISNARKKRAANLIIKLVKNADVYYSDARAVGYCDPGIKSFCERYHITFSTTNPVKLSVISDKHETYSLCNYMAKKIIESKFNFI